MAATFFASKEWSIRKPLLLSLNLLLIVLSVVLGSACRGQQTSAPHPEYAPTATITDIMEAIIDPSADVVWESVQTVVTPGGTDEQMPKNDEEWAAVRRGAIRVVEGTTLLMM